MKPFSRNLIIVFALLLTSYTGFANMASPWIREGGLTATSIVSRDIDIEHEQLVITVDSGFNKAHYDIEYHIQTEQAGKQIPMLFLALDDNTDFKVWVDDTAVELKNLPSYSDTSFLRRYGGILWLPEHESEDMFSIDYWENGGRGYKANQLKYFELNLTKGKHVIKVQYNALSEIYKGNWVHSWEYHYSLSPAKYWKSFGTLQIILRNKDHTEPVTTNLGEPATGNVTNEAVWNFDKLPVKIIDLKYVPSVNVIAWFLLLLKPVGMTFIFSVLLIMLHTWFMRRFRKRNKTSWSLHLIFGSIAVPFFALFMYMESYAIIDYFIGEHASRYHGYVFFAFILYPVLLPVYFFIMYFYDKGLKKQQE